MSVSKCLRYCLFNIIPSINHLNDLLANKMTPKKEYWLISVILIWGVFMRVNAQNDKVIRATNVSKLQTMSRQYRLIGQKKRANLLQKAQLNGWIVRKQLSDGRVIELKDISPSGLPIYYITYNLEGATTIGTDQVWEGGDLGLSLSGKDMYAQSEGENYARLGVWDGGAVRTTHQEFGPNNRVIQRDNSSNLNDHATHVAGTMAAQGVNMDAKGMAWQAPLDAFDWNADESEMALAASRGMLISNHSYGTLTGWAYGNFSGNVGWHWFGNPSISQEEDYGFGFYGLSTQLWDQIAYDAPYYLIVKAAGNDRNDTGPSDGEFHWYRDPNQFWQWVISDQARKADGNYNSIAWRGNAKNILTVGAVSGIPNGYTEPQDVKMSAFSSWGPTDDGRIKPDICAKGVQVFSTVSGGDLNYTFSSGTSMASPGVAGSLLLLQEHYEDLQGEGNFMKAATLKALVIHTAEEAGDAEGPDYEHGWGLMNTAAAAELISENAIKNQELISEESIENGQIISRILYPSGDAPLVVTIAWTDLPSDFQPNSLNPEDLSLVNDLDIRLSDGQNEYFPYILNPANPSAAASTGDNFRDNVEKIYIANPNPSQPLTLQITHKRNLNGNTQAFSLIVSGIEAAPNFDYDAGIIQIKGIDELNCGVATSSIQPQIILRNFALKNLNQVDIMYQLDSASPERFVWNGNLNPGAQEEITLPEIPMLDGNYHLLRVFTEKPNGEEDQAPSNDASERSFNTVIDEFPYLANFESGPEGWTSDGFRNPWQLGTPEGNIIQAASEGQQAWVTNLSGNYQNGTNAYLLSPSFDLSQFDEASLSFDLILETEEAYDGLQVQVSTDCGKTWSLLGDNRSGDNWYNSQNVPSFGDFAGLAWTGSSNGNWVKRSHSLEGFLNQSQVQFRFLMKSDGSVTAEGLGIDQVQIQGTTSRKSQQISFDALTDKTYGNKSFNLFAESSAGLEISFTSSNPNVLSIVGNTATIKGAGEVTITASQSGDSEYQAAIEVFQTIDIQKAPLLITADNQSKFFGQTNPELTLSYAGLVNNDQPSELDAVPTASTTALRRSPSGIYTIEVQGGQDKNYDFSFQEGILRVEKVPIELQIFDEEDRLALPSCVSDQVILSFFLSPQDEAGPVFFSRFSLNANLDLNNKLSNLRLLASSQPTLNIEDELDELSTGIVNSDDPRQLLFQDFQDELSNSRYYFILADISQENLGQLSLTLEPSSFVISEASLSTRDASKINQDINFVSDIELPTIQNCPKDITLFSLPGLCSNVVTWEPPSASDNCSVVLESNFASGTSFPVGQTEVIYTATDPAGNQSTCSFFVKIRDQEAPVITLCPTDIQVFTNNANCTATVSWDEPIAQDACEEVSLRSNHTPGSEFPIGTTEVIYTAEDASGNQTICRFNIIVKDQSAPIFTRCPNDITAETQNGQCGAKVNWDMPLVNDACGNADLQSTHPPGFMFSIGTTEVMYTATDESGNQSTCRFNVIVKDQSAPVFIQCPGDMEVILGAETENCQAVVNWTPPLVQDACGELTLESNFEPGASFKMGMNEVIYTAKDKAGNQSQCRFNILVKDTLRPQFTQCPADIILDLPAGQCNTIATWEPPQYQDNCSGELSISSNYTSGSVFPTGVTEVNYVIEDASGNQNTCSFKVIVKDQSPPQISQCPTDIQVSVDPGQCTAIINWDEPQIIDPCGGSLRSTHQPGDAFPIGTTVVRYTARDAFGNEYNCRFTIQVKDQEAPVFTNCPANITVQLESERDSIEVNWEQPTALETCGSLSELSSNFKPGDLFPVGTREVLYIARDDQGNEAECRFKVTVLPAEIQAPAISTDSLKADLINIYPNPNPGSIIYLTFSKPISGDIILEMIDLQGRKVGSLSLYIASPREEVRVEISREISYYYLKIQGENINNSVKRLERF